jgi:predicted nucleotidyltransferase
MESQSLKQAADVIRNRYSRSRILLFGSHARNSAFEHSDIDLCVIIDGPEERLLDIGRNIRKEIFPILHNSLDILVYDKETFEDRASLSFSFEAEITEHSLEL